jgi:hypothetical protein
MEARDCIGEQDRRLGDFSAKQSQKPVESENQLDGAVGLNATQPVQRRELLLQLQVAVTVLAREYVHQYVLRAVLVKKPLVDLDVLFALLTPAVVELAGLDLGNQVGVIFGTN